MSDPSSPSRGKIPSRIAAALRRLHWKDVLIGVLALLFLSMSGYRVPGAAVQGDGPVQGGGSGGETVSVFNVVVDREGRQ